MTAWPILKLGHLTYSLSNKFNCTAPAVQPKTGACQWLKAVLSSISTEWYGSVSLPYGTHFLAFPLSKEYQVTILCRSCFSHSFIVIQSGPKGLKSEEQRSAVGWLQTGKKLFLSVVVQLLVCHFSKFYVFFRQECYHFDLKYIVSLSK